jgi:hypothetical protein
VPPETNCCTVGDAALKVIVLVPYVNMPAFVQLPPTVCVRALPPTKVAPLLISILPAIVNAALAVPTVAAGVAVASPIVKLP